MQTKRILLIFTLLFSSTIFADDHKADDVLGYWLSEEKTGVIHIQKDEKENTYYGEIVWIKDIHDGKVKERLDTENPDERLRSRSVLGLKNTWGFKFDGDDEWEDGKIYDPKNGKTYSAKMELEDGGKILELRGFIGISLLGRTTEWTRETGKVPAYVQKK